MLYEYCVVIGGSGCVRTTNSVMMPNDAPAPFNACPSHEYRVGMGWGGHDTHEEEVRVERLARAYDDAVCEDDLNLEDVVKRGAPETRERAEATDRGVSCARQGPSQSVGQQVRKYKPPIPT
jgi:hypothetical protein